MAVIANRYGPGSSGTVPTAADRTAHHSHYNAGERTPAIVAGGFIVSQPEAAAAPEEVTGTIVAGEDNDTSSITAGHGPSGSSTATEAADTSSITAGHGPSGSIAQTEAADTSTISAGHGPSGAIAATELADTSNASGSVIVAITGTIAVTEDADLSTITAGHGPTGSATATETPDTADASGLVANPVTGTAEITEQDDTSTAVGIGGVVVSGKQGGARKLLIEPARPLRRHLKPEYSPQPVTAYAHIGEDLDLCVAVGVVDLDAEIAELARIGVL